MTESQKSKRLGATHDTIAGQLAPVHRRKKSRSMLGRGFLVSSVALLPSGF
jgi:hypothetical protein